jgi:DNA-binding HxlR family transcriptional regulator
MSSISVAVREPTGLVEHSQEGYRVTPTGRELYALLVPLGVWAKKWATKLPG